MDKARLVWAILYFLVGISIVFFFRSKIFYPDATGYNTFRFVWCVSSCCFGFSAIAYRVAIDGRRHGSTLPSYFTYYPVMLLVLSCIAFSVLITVKATSGYIFYYASFALCFILAYLVDVFWGILLKLLPQK